MAERPEHNPHASEEARQGAITKRLAVVIAILAGAVGALLWRYSVG
jgi:hypothetical protein